MSTRSELKALRREYGDLLESHGGRRLEEFKRYEKDPESFIREVLKAEPWEAQVAIAEDVLKSPLVCVKSGNGLGKDWLAAHLALWWTYARRGLVLVTGPTQKQVREIVMGEVAMAWGKAGDLPGELYTTALRVPGDDKAGIISFTSTEVSRLTGHHADRIMVIITEGQGCPPFAYEAAYRCAVGANDRMLVVGNPNSRSCTFAQLFESDAWSQHTISCFDCPNVLQGEEVIRGMMTLQGIARIESEYGKGSGVYAAAVLGEFPSEDSEALIRRYWLEQSAERFRTGTQSEDAPIIAVDPARYGNDKTACAIKRGNQIGKCETWSQRDMMETVDKIVDLAERVGVTPHRENPPYQFPTHGRIVVDVIGLGSGVLDRLKQLRYETREFNASRKARKADKFQNLRAEAFWELRRQLEAGQIDIEWDPLLVDELTSLQWAPNAAGKIAMESKDDLRSRIGRSCDRADATVMALSGGIDRRVRIQVGLYGGPEWIS